MWTDATCEQLVDVKLLYNVEFDALGMLKRHQAIVLRILASLRNVIIDFEMASIFALGQQEFEGYNDDFEHILDKYTEPVVESQTNPLQTDN